MFISFLFGVMTLYTVKNHLIVVEIFLVICIFFCWCYNGPLNAVLLNCVKPEIRSLANGVCMLIIHLFGDAISPSIIGWISDNSYGNLRDALLIVPLSLLLCSVIWFCGWLTLPSSSKFPCCPAFCYQFSKVEEQVTQETDHLMGGSRNEDDDDE